MRITGVLIFLIFFINTLNAQVAVPNHIAVQLKDKKGFKDYAKLMTRYLDSLLVVAKDSTEKKDIKRKYKKLARQLQYLEEHQDANGNIVNVSELTLKALQEYEQSPIAAPSSPHLGDWTIVGPLHVLESYGNKGIGRVDRIAFNPTNPSIMYAGTPAGGLWKSVNGGTLWNNLNAYIPSLGISGVVVSHANPTTLYVLTGDGDSNLGLYGFVEGFDYIRPSIGVLKSTDDGQSWTRTNLNIPGFYVGYKLIQSPNDANVLLAATSKGIYRTDNGGSSWELASSDSSRFYDIEWMPGSPATVYACTGNRFFISATAGISFADVTNRIPDNINACQRIALAVTPSNANVVYVYAGQNVNNAQRLRLFRSTNSGGNFFSRSDMTVSGGGVQYMLNVAADPGDFNRVVASNLISRFSDDGGTTFARSNNTDNDASSKYMHADVHELAYNPNTRMLYVGCDGGVFTSDDHGVSFFQRFFGMSNTQFYHFSVADDDENLMVGGAQDNGLMFKNDATGFFKNYKAGDGFDVAMPHSVGTYVVSTVNTETYFYSKTFPSEYWYLTVQNNVWYKPVATSWFDSTKYAGGTQILKWRAFGNNTVNVSSYDANGRWALETSPSNGNRLYAAGGPEWNDDGDQSEKTMMRSDDNAVTWTALQNNTGFPTSFGKITSIAIHPTNSNKVYVTIGGYHENVKVYYSANAGSSWTNVSAGLANLPVNASVVNDNGDLYIGTDIGVFYRPEGGSWMPYFNGLPKIPVTDLQIVNSYIYASTFGRGIWGSSTHGNCPPTVNITSNQSGRVVYEAKSITASSQLINGAGTEIYLKAENDVTLNPGFLANANTGVEFRSYIAPCGINGLPLAVPVAQGKSVTSVKMDSTSLQFELKFPALLYLCVTDSSNNIVAYLQRPVRLNEGEQKLSIAPIKPEFKLVLVVDGEAIEIK